MAKGIYVGVSEQTQSLSTLPVGSLVKDPNSKFLGKPIIWKMADKNHAGYPNNSVTLITDKIVAMRAFDAKEPNNSNSDRKSYGNNRYLTSNIRQWLNSDASAGNWYLGQTLVDQPPSSTNDVSCNAYFNDTGFLNGFSNNFKNAILNTTLTVAKNTVTDGGGSETVVDKIFLASNTEVGWTNENNIVEGALLPIFSNDANRTAYCTQQAIEDSDYSSDPANDVTAWYWWLRTPNSGNPQMARLVNGSGGVGHYYAYGGQYGVRPLCNIPSSILVSTTKDSDGCYTLFATAGDVAKKVKKVYVGVSDKARKVKKGYIGVSGVARPFFSSEPELSYYGTATALSVARDSLAGVSVGNYGLFGGGYGDGYSDVVDAYSTNLTRSIPTALSVARNRVAGVSVGNYGLFGGGKFGSGGSDYSTAVDAYNTSLTRSTPTVLSVARGNLAGVSVGNYGLFGGGRGSVASISTAVDAYNTSLTRSTPTALSVKRTELAAVSVGNYGLFGGGYGSGYSAVVDAYNTSLTRSTPTALSVARSNFAGVSVGNYGLFGGGVSSSSASCDVVDAYNTNLTKSTPTALSTAKVALAGVAVENYGLFSGDNSNSVVDVYNTDLTKSTPTALSARRNYLAGVAVGNYGLFGGGGYSDVVDVYHVV